MENSKVNENGRTVKYLAGLFVFLGFMEILDTYTTMFPTMITSHLQNEFLPGLAKNVQDSEFSKALAIASIGMYLGIFTRLFADIWGRRIWLFLTALGMGLGALFISMSNSLTAFTFALMFMYIWFSSDTWAIYVAEEAPKERRGIFQNVVLMAGIIGAVLVTVARAVFITDTAQNWRAIAMFGVLGVVLALFVLKIDETAPYKELVRKRKQANLPKPNPFKTLLQPLLIRQYRNDLMPVLIIMFMVGFTHSVGAMIESLFSAHLGHAVVSKLIGVTIFWVLVGYGIIGLAMDKFGRRPVRIVSAVVGPIAGFILVFGLQEWGWTNFWVLGCIQGVTTVAGQGILLPNKIAGYESVPTEMRGTAASWMAFVRAIGNTAGLAATSYISLHLGLGWAVILITCTFVIAIPTVFFLGKETKGIDLREV
ncbi:MAG: MFS transporter [Proteobacteria bacterium]|nr:MFS transporter [Pseudomonadota bacterium]